MYIGTYPKVYKDQAIAIKVIIPKRPDKVRAIGHELSMLALVGGFPGITKLLAWSEKDNVFKLAFHIHECQDLFTIIKTITIEQTVKFIIEILTALQYMHSKNIVHSDIKAENIMLDCKEPGKYTNAVIIDLGAACFEDDTECLKNATKTIFYASPERILGEKFDRSSDIRAIGVLAWEMLTRGHMPFGGDSNTAVAINVVKMAYKFPSHFTDDQKVFFDSIFQKDPTSRPTAEQLLKSKWISG